MKEYLGSVLKGYGDTVMRLGEAQRRLRRDHGNLAVGGQGGRGIFGHYVKPDLCQGAGGREAGEGKEGRPDSTPGCWKKLMKYELYQILPECR